MNYFELLGLQPAFSIDQKELTQRYFALQKQYHPDFYTDATELEREQVLETSSAINKAYHIFKNPATTLEYVLQWKGIIIADEKYSLPPDFLMEMMELNEALGEATPETLPDLQQQLVTVENDLSASVAPLLKDNLPAAGEPGWQQLKAFYYQKKYLERIKERLRNIAAQ
jgi:molecular chaperone HscB